MTQFVVTGDDYYSYKKTKKNFFIRTMLLRPILKSLRIQDLR